MYHNTLHCIVAGKAAGGKVVSQYNLEYCGRRHGLPVSQGRQLCRDTTLGAWLGARGAQARGTGALGRAGGRSAGAGGGARRGRRAAGRRHGRAAGRRGACRAGRERDLGVQLGQWAVHLVHSACFDPV